MDRAIRNIVVVGGGTAGWLTAGMIAAEHAASGDQSVNVTLLESPNVSTIGVGEGTWPSMRNTLDKIGISETDFIQQCDASFKQASKFVAWKNGDINDHYYHPFMVPEGYIQVNLHHHWQQHYSTFPFADILNAQSVICEAGLAPKQPQTPEYAGVLNYGYHLDAGKFATLLHKHCTEKLNVTHIIDHMTSVVDDSDGYIEGLETENNGQLNGDLFIDCTGLNALLIGKHYDIPFLEQKHVLFNDTAMATHVPYPDDKAIIASATISTAQDAGWIWDIGLPTRRGVGYTYSSKHCDDESAKATLLEYIKRTAGDDIAAKTMPRKISFNPGYRAKFWHKNCVAVGMSSGFLEPLEASALALVELSSGMISEELPVNREHMEIVAQRYNQRFEYRWQRTIEFLKLHYVISEREDSQYWRDNKNPDTIPQRLQELLSLWKYQPPSRLDFVQNEEIFASASYQYVLYGMGFYTQNRETERQWDNQQHAHHYLEINKKKTQQFLGGLPTNRDLLNSVYQNGMAKPQQ